MVLGIDDAIAAGLKILDKFIPDPEQREKAKLELLKLQQQADFKVIDTIAASDNNQAEINKVEAANSNLFVSGWRPAVGWVCVISLAYHFILQPFVAFSMAASGHAVQLPVFDMSTLDTILMGLLGLGGMRSWEKMKGVASK